MVFIIYLSVFFAHDGKKEEMKNDLPDNEYKLVVGVPSL